MRYSRLLLVVAIGVLPASAGPIHHPERWAEPIASLEVLLARFPPTETNRAALRVESFAATVGIHLAPRQKGLPPRRRQEEQPYREALREYVARELLAVGSAIGEPPASLREFLLSHRQTIDELIGLLQQTEPRWEQSLDRLQAAPIPNLLGHLDLNRLLIADALVRARDGAPTDAFANLEAAWRFGDSLVERAELISRLIGLAENRQIAAALRRIDGIPEVWTDRLARRGWPELMLEALHTTGWIEAQLPEPEESEGWMRRVYWKLGQPYYFFCRQDADENWRKQIVRLGSSSSLCSLDSVQQEDDFIDSLAWWNRAVGRSHSHLLEAFERATVGAVELELTSKIIELDRVRRANGEWPADLEGIESSRVCPDRRWLYAVEPDGRAALAIDAEPSRRTKGALGPQYPLRWISSE